MDIILLFGFMEWLGLTHGLKITLALSSSSHKTHQSPWTQNHLHQVPQGYPLVIFSERSKEFSNQSSKCLCGDISKTLLVINPESILEFPLHGLHVRILYQECGTKLAELSKLNLTRTILINLCKEFFKFILSRSEPHGSHDLSQVISRQEFYLLGVKQIKTNFQTFDLIWLKSGVFSDFIKVNISIGVSCMCHFEAVGCVEAGGVC